ncbi:MAG: response regulator [Phycisphaerae bacterium]
MPKDPIRILLVEDNPGDVRLLEHALWQVPRIVTKVSRADSVAALRALLAKEAFDVILLDLDLPDSRGLSTVHSATAAAPSMPIIVLTGINDESVGMDAVRRGAQDYLVKGEVDGWQLIRTIHYAIERKQTQLELRKAYEQTEHRVAQNAMELCEAASELTLAEQRERRRLAQVIHDHVEQLLVEARGHLSFVSDKISDGESQSALAHIDGLLEKSVEAVHSLRVELSPPALYDIGLAGALRWLGQWMQETHGLSVSVESDIELPADSEGVCDFLFQAVRELLVNVVKHARVNKALIRMSPLAPPADGQGAGGIQILVSDDGVGFDPATLDAAPGAGGGFRLISAQRRMRLLGGRLDIDSAPGKGARILLTLPLSRRQ